MWIEYVSGLVDEFERHFIYLTEMDRNIKDLECLIDMFDCTQTEH